MTQGEKFEEQSQRDEVFCFSRFPNDQQRFPCGSPPMNRPRVIARLVQAKIMQGGSLSTLSQRLLVSQNRQIITQHRGERSHFGVHQYLGHNRNRRGLNKQSEGKASQ